MTTCFFYNLNYVFFDSLIKEFTLIFLELNGAGHYKMEQLREEKKLNFISFS